MFVSNNNNPNVNFDFILKLARNYEKKLNVCLYYIDVEKLKLIVFHNLRGFPHVELINA